MTLTADGTITKKDDHVVPTPNVIDAETYMADREALNQKYAELKRIELVPIYEDHTNCLDKEDIAQEDFKAEDSAYYEEWGYTDYLDWFKTTYVAVRDLEALGFTLSYQAEPERLTLTPAE